MSLTSNTSSAKALSLVIVSAIGVFSVGVVYFIFLHSKKGTDDDEQYKRDIPLALPLDQHFILGHAVHLGTLEGHRKICVAGATSDGISRFFILKSTAVSVLRGEHVRAIVSASNYRKRIPTFEKHNDMLLGPKALTFLMHDEWRSIRKVMTRAFNWESLKSMMGDVNSVSKVFVSSLLTLDGQTIDIWPIVKCATIDIIGRTSFGYDFGSSESLTPSKEVLAFELLLSEHTKRTATDPLNPLNMWYWLPTDANRKFKDASALIRSTISRIVAARMQQRLSPSYVSSDHTDMLTYMLDALDDDKASSVCDTSNPQQVLADNLMTLLFAGYDTSSITLAYAFFLMSKYPGIASRVRGEISSVVGKEGDLTYEDATSRLPFCTAVINEVMRLFPPVPLTTRHLEEDLELRVNESTTTVLPAGTMVFLPIWWIHRSSLNFDRPEHFDPDRFFDETRAADIHRYAHIPFSGGARDCIGRRFAMIEVLTIFAHVMRRVDFSCAADYELRPEVHGFLQKPPEGVVLTVRSLLQE